MICEANSGSRTVSVINGTTNTRTKEIHVGNWPMAIALDTIRNKIYVTNVVSNTVSVINVCKVGIQPLYLQGG